MAVGEFGLDIFGNGSFSFGGQAPTVGNFSPICGSVNLPLTQVFTFDVTAPNNIDLASTTVTVRIGATVETAYSAGAFASGWTVGSSTSPITDGHRFTLARNTAYPGSVSVSITVAATALGGGGVTTHICTYTIRGAVSIVSAEFINLNKILITFNTCIRSSDISALTTVSSWSVRPISGNRVYSAENFVTVRAVIPENRFNPTFAVLDVSRLVPHQRYEIKAVGFSDIFHQLFVGDELVAGEARQTKTDSIFSSLPGLWEGSRTSNLFWLLSGIAREDDAIGGARGVVSTGTLRRLF